MPVFPKQPDSDEPPAKSASKLARKKLPPLVRFEWVDSTSFGGWQDIGSKVTVHTMHSRGFLLSLTKKQIVISSSYDPELGSALDLLAVPRSVIRKLRRVKGG